MTKINVFDGKQVAREYSRIMKRLDRSVKRTARKNARLELKRFLDVIWKRNDQEFPPFRKDGTPIERKRKTGAFCFACDSPMKDFATLAQHLSTHHGWRKPGFGTPLCVCVCSKKFIPTARIVKKKEGRRVVEVRQTVSEVTALARHLSSIKDLRLHFTLGALDKV